MPMKKHKAAVLVAQVDIPPTKHFEHFIEDALKGTFTPVIKVEELPRNWNGTDLAGSVEVVVQTAADLLDATPDALFAAYIMPTAIQIEYTDNSPCSRLPMIFIAIRSRHGNEWFYVDLFGQTHPSIVNTIAPTIDQVLEKREALCRPVSIEHYSDASRFIECLRSGVGHTFATLPDTSSTIQ